MNNENNTAPKENVELQILVEIKWLKKLNGLLLFAVLALAVLMVFILYK